MKRITHFRTDKETFHHHPGVGTFAVPAHEQRKLDECTDQQLFEACEPQGFIDPFVFGEINLRGLYHEYIQWKNPDPEPEFSILEHLVLLEMENNDEG